ncbi:phage major capsid protein [Pseudorhodoferax soli]|uniref:HK97 family phage major capsid protein n=1 Tax=Pseudorhodoferax soli TaxID=545864 RepID=A0A368Y3D6_9BURK|nr:phage major capsid protein [Pseudorhodoferax soli]RCW73818.1 HK97 family phage major capsid protein [Pseudorhodoferax soli]
MKTYAQQLADLKATRTTKSAELDTIARKPVDEGRSMDTGEAEQFDTLTTAIKSLDADISRFSRMAEIEAAEKDSAKPVDATTKAAAIAVGGAAERLPVQVKNTEKVEEGIGFARIARIKALARLDNADPLQVASALYPDDKELRTSLTKAAVPAANTGNAGWAGNLILDGGAYFADFVTHLRAKTVLGQIEARLRRLPFDTPVLVQGSAGAAKWVGEGKSKPVTQWSYAKTKLEPLKVATIAAATKETIRRASAAADALIRDELTLSIGTALDGTLVGTAAAVAGVSPAGLRNGVTATVLAGDGSLEGIRLDIATMLKALVGNNLSVAGAFWLMAETTAIDLGGVTNLAGAAAFPGITPEGGTLAGLPAFTSQAIPANVVMLVKGDEIFLGDEGGIEVSISDQASIVMDDAPAQDATTGAPGTTSVVSLWQTNSVGFLVERIVNFMKRRPGAVVWATVNWTGQPTP